MRRTTLLAAAASLLACADAFKWPAFGRREAQPQTGGVVHLQTFRDESPLSPSERARLRLRKRAGTITEILDNESTLYYATLELGSPSQSLRLAVDTGSSDLWTNAPNSQLCQRYSQQCAQTGTFAANRSESYRYINSAFYIRYADGSYAVGDYGSDTLIIGGARINNLQFGIGYNSTSIQGILGIGYATNEASISTTGRSYPNLPQLLVQQGVTNTMVYSLWLNDLDANTGSILFGGIDTAKFQGSLTTIPIIREQGIYREFVVGLSSLTAGGQQIFSSNPIPVLLDSGSSLTYLPNTYAAAIFQIFSAQYDQAAGAASVNCNLRSSTATVDFTFSGLRIQVPMNELVLVDGYRSGRAVCILGITAAGGSTSVLGDTFLRSAYVVYDLTNNQISMAPTNFNATGTNVVTVQSGATGLPGATLASNPVSTLSVQTGGARNGGQPGVTAVGSLAAAPPRRTAMPAVQAVGKVAVAAAAAGWAFAL